MDIFALIISCIYSNLDVATASLDDKLKLFTSTVTNGNSLELKCDVKGAGQIVWKRNGGLLSEIASDEMRMFEDGSLYIGHVGYAFLNYIPYRCGLGINYWFWPRRASATNHL